MKLSEEMAVRLHRMMWSDMQRELGDRPDCADRLKFKCEWVERNFPGEHIANDCWLCEYASSVANQNGGDPYCKYCPISWPNRHCNTLDFSYARKPISEILAVPAKNKEIEAKRDEAALVRSYYNYREELLYKASGIPASLAIEDHVKAIQEKAVEEYFAKSPGAKLATMDVDDAFKQYADEQKEPIFKQLSKASGLSENNQSVCSHIEWIKNKAKQEGRDEKKQQMKDLLAEQSGLDRNRPIDDHIHEIVKNSMEAGATEERDRIQEKIYEVLLS